MVYTECLTYDATLDNNETENTFRHKGMKHVEYYILKEIQQILESKDEEIRFTDIYRQRVLWLLDSH